MPAPRARARAQVWRAVWELLHDLSVAVLFCFFLITFVAQAFLEKYKPARPAP